MNTTDASSTDPSTWSQEIMEEYKNNPLFRELVTLKDHVDTIAILINNIRKFNSIVSKRNNIKIVHFSYTANQFKLCFGRRTEIHVIDKINEYLSKAPQLVLPSNLAYKQFIFKKMGEYILFRYDTSYNILNINETHIYNSYNHKIMEYNEISTALDMYIKDTSTTEKVIS